MRGTNSNHTLVLLNGIAINDQSTTQGLHNFGQDFVQTLQKIEIFKGPNGAHFGPSLKVQQHHKPLVKFIPTSRKALFVLK